MSSKYMPNIIKTDFASYRHFWRGTPKIGKTTMFRDVVEHEYGDAKHGLLISLGNETGYKAIPRIYAVEAREWKDFTDIVDDLVENKNENEFKVIAIDTVDELIELATERTLKVHFIRKSEKIDSINKALGGFGNGQKYVQRIVNEEIRKIESAGYGLIFIGHTKVKDIIEKGMEEPYQQLTSNLESRYSKIFNDKADIIATFYEDRAVSGDDELVSTRYIYFRSDGFVDAGSRFPDIPVRVEMSAENYVDAFNFGVRASSGGLSDKVIKKMKDEEVKIREEKGSEYSEKAKSGSVEDFDGLETVQDYRDTIEDYITTMTKGVRKQTQQELKDA